ncbi:dTMP kinase [Candidatus Pacearchaeota archaeon]|nr:dTMP kinase [Candidatus Pacearchaeota archaeon]
MDEKRGYKPGLFIVWEGPDGSGKSTQLEQAAKAIRMKNKYQDILLTREPTFRASELKKMLQEQSNPFDGGIVDLHLFVQDRKIHTEEQIIPASNQRTLVFCDRYSMSTGAYQSAQGVPVEDIIKYHEEAKTLTPDLTIYVDISREVAEQRMIKRGDKREKFENNSQFNELLINRYRELVALANADMRARKVFGPIVRINGNQEIEKVTEDILKVIMPVYDAWLTGQ